MIPERKICGECLEEKEAKCFSIRQKKNSEHKWLRKECKDCQNKKRKDKYNLDPTYREKRLSMSNTYLSKNREKRSEYHKKRRLENIDTIKEKARLRYLKDCEIVKNKRKEYYKNNKQRQIESVNNYVIKNKPKVRHAQRLNHKKKIETDLNYKITKILRGRVTAAIKKKGEKHAKTKDLIGCTVKELIIRIESMFWPGMTWQNHGVHGWHVDHIIPCDKFDMTNEEDQRKCFHYTNLQPLWAADNIRKSNKLDYNPNKAA